MGRVRAELPAVGELAEPGAGPSVGAADRAAVSAHLRAAPTGMLPRVELPEVILEVMSWAPQLVASFTAVSGGRSRLEDLPTSVAACLSVPLLLKGRRRQVA